MASARRLGVQPDRPLPGPPAQPGGPRPQTMAGMRALQDVGLVDHVGVSNYSLDRWRGAEAALGRPVLSNQVQYSPGAPPARGRPAALRRGERPTGDRLQPARSGAARGRGTRAQNPPSGAIRRLNPLFLPVNLERLAPLLAVLREVADAHEHHDVAGRPRLRGRTARAWWPSRARRASSRSSRMRRRGTSCSRTTRSQGSRQRHVPSPGAGQGGAPPARRRRQGPAGRGGARSVGERSIALRP